MRSHAKKLDTIVTYLILILVSFLFLFPCVWLIISSLSSTGSIYDFTGFFPKSLSFASYTKLFTDTTMYNYPRWMMNTLFVGGMSSILGTTLVILTAYTISRFRFRGRKAIMKITLVLGMFPSFMGMTALYLLMMNFKLINSLWSLIFINVGLSPMGYLVQKGYFDTISSSIYEAARIDGASNAAIFRKITLPLTRPMLVYTCLTSFTFSFSDFILPKMLLQDKNKWTVAVGLMSLNDTEFARFAAGAVFIAVPIVVVYFLLSKNLIQGMSSGAVKQ